MNLFENVFNQQRRGIYNDMVRAYPSMKYNLKELDRGNKIVMSEKSLVVMSQFNMPNIYIFEIQTLRSKITVHVGVLDFTAPDDEVILPNWLFIQLGLKQGEMIKLHLIQDMPKGVFLKIKPHKTEFIQLEDPKGILEVQLRNYSCVTQNQTININFMDKNYFVDILEVQPQNTYNAIILIDTDIKLEFEAPLDYVEKKTQQAQSNKQIDRN